MKWTMSRDGKKRATFRVAHRLDRESLAAILCYRALSLGWDLGESRSVAYLEGQIRDELASHGTATWPYWREHDYDHQATEVEAWAREQVSRL